MLVEQFPIICPKCRKEVDPEKTNEFNLGQDPLTYGFIICNTCFKMDGSYLYESGAEILRRCLTPFIKTN